MGTFALWLPWVLVAFGCWIGFNLIRQNGRILMRLETSERLLVDLKARVVSAPAPQPAAPAMPQGLAVGTPAPIFELPDLRGELKKLSDWRGREVLLVFFNPQCGFCVQIAPQLAALAREAKSPSSLLPVVVTTGDAEANRKLLAEHGIDCPALLQKQMEVASLFQVSGTPIGYRLDTEGNIASEIAIGGDALLRLAKPAEAPGESKAAANGNGHAAHQGNRDLASSKIARDGLPPGSIAPDFRLPRIDGGELALADYRGRRVLLVFSDPGCGPCQQLAPHLNQAALRHRDIDVIMISRGDEEANRQKAREHKLKFPVVLQRQWEISKLYAKFATPIGYLIDEYGIIASEVAIGAEPILALVSNQSAATRG